MFASKHFLATSDWNKMKKKGGGGVYKKLPDML